MNIVIGTCFLMCVRAPEEEGDSVGELLNIGKKGLYGGLGFCGLLVICIGVQYAHDAYKKWRRRQRIKKRLPAILARKMKET